MKLNLSLGQRIGIGFFLLTLLVLFASSLGLVLAQSVETTLNTTQAGTQHIQAIRNLERHWASVTATVDQMLLTRQTGLIEQSLQESLAAFNQELANLDQSNTLTDSDEAAATINNLQSFGAELNELVGEITLLAEDGRWAQAQTRRQTEMSSIQRQFDDNLDQFGNLVEAEVAASVSQAIQLQNSLRTFWIIAAAAALVAGVVVSIFTVRSITLPVKELTNQVQQMSQRNFADIVPLNRNDEIGKLSQAFAQMADWLRESYQELELRVAQRTQALQVSNEVSRSLSNILNLDSLVIQVVEQIQSRFDYYHVHIYLFDDARENLVLVGGTGEAGAAMLAANHVLAPSQGLVGQAASSREVMLIPNVAEAESWLPNPLLPDTRAEIAVPIVIADDVLGVLDVQHHVANGLTQMDADLLQSIANQVAIAVQNARSYQRVRSQREYEAVASKIGQKIRLATSVEDVLQVAARELATALELPRLEVALHPPGKSGDHNNNQSEENKVHASL